MSKAEKVSPSMRRWLARIVVAFLPFALAGVTITLLVSSFYPRWAYARSSFPADLAGASPSSVAMLAERYAIAPEQVAWTQAQRLELALVAVDYLGRWGSAADTIYLLEDQRIPGSQASLYNDAEIKHMIDVKVLTDIIRWATVVGVPLLGLAAYGLAGDRQQLARAIWRGGVATVVLLAVLGLFILLAWDIFFVQFHELLFPPDSWTFFLTDSLIRLFPEKFWFDFGVLAVGSIFVEGLVVMFAGRSWYNRLTTRSAARRRPKRRRVA